MDRKEFFQALTGLAFTPTAVGGLWAPPKELASGVVSEVIPIDNGALTMKAQIWRGSTLVLDSGHISVMFGTYVWSANHNPLAQILSVQEKVALSRLTLRAEARTLVAR